VWNNQKKDAGINAGILGDFWRLFAWTTIMTLTNRVMKMTQGRRRRRIVNSLEYCTKITKSVWEMDKTTCQIATSNRDRTFTSSDDDNQVLRTG